MPVRRSTVAVRLAKFDAIFYLTDDSFEIARRMHSRPQEREIKFEPFDLPAERSILMAMLEKAFDFAALLVPWASTLSFHRIGSGNIWWCAEVS